MKAVAKTHWVWTKKAEKGNPTRSKAGERVWEHYAHEAPRKWLDDGLIIDNSEYVREGQMEIFDILDM